MKTFTIRLLNVLFTLMLFVPSVHADAPQLNKGTAIQKVSSTDMVVTVIDIKGNRYSDRMWIFSVPECTRDFDNGWDGFKMFGSPLTPQLYSMEANGNFQVNSVPDINETNLGFFAGEDSIYTLTFTNYNTEKRYKKLFLVDLLENKTIDIYTSGTQYTFKAAHTAAPVKRFQIITGEEDQLVAVTGNRVGTVIDVKGSRFSDRLSVYSDSSSTVNYDKGWDVTKTFGSALNPQIYAMEADGNYQLNSVNDINDTYLGFLPGEDTNYTLTFTHENVDLRYQELYLVDLLENKTIDIYASGTTYSFVAEQTNTPVKRFVIITSLPEPVIVVDDEVSKNPKTPKDLNVLKNANSKLKIFNSQRTIVIDNPGDAGELTLYNAQSGRIVSKYSFNGNGITTLSTDIPEGVYVVKGITRNEMLTERIIVR